MLRENSTFQNEAEIELEWGKKRGNLFSLPL